MYFVPPHTALRKGLKEGTSTPRLREIYCLDSLSLGSHRRPGAELAVGTPKSAFAAPQETRGRLRRRRSARPASDPHLPRPEAGPRAPRGVRGGRREAGRPVGGRAGAEEVRPRCRPARFLPRPRQQRRGPDPRLPGPVAVREPRTHSPSQIPAGQLSPARLSRASATKTGRTRHSGVPDTLNRPPQSRALGADHPPTHTHTYTARAHTHTHRNLRRLRERRGSAPHPTHTHSLWVLARRSPNSHNTPTHIRPSPTSFPRESRSSAQRSRCYSKARKHSTSFSSSGPEEATAAISPRQGKHTHTNTRARARAPGPHRCFPSGAAAADANTNTHGRASLPPARPEGKPRRRPAGPRSRLARDGRAERPGLGSPEGLRPPPHLHSARRGPGGDGGGGGGAAAAGAAAAGEAAAAVAAGLRAAKTCRQPAGGRGTGRRGRGAGGPGRAA